MLNRLSLYFTWLLYGLTILAVIYLIPIMMGCDGVYETCWSRWDSGLYLDIARNGITLIPCPDNSSQWCGNAGWGPLYSYLVRWGSPLFEIKDTIMAGALSALFTWLSILVALRFKKKENKKHWYLYGLFYLFGLGSIYMYAIFPISLIVLLVTLILVSLKNKKPLLAAIFTSIACLSYSTGFLLIPLYALYLLLNEGRGAVKKIDFWSNCFVASIGLLVLLALDYFATGHWNALFLIQAKYGHAIQNPLKVLGQRADFVIEHFSNLKMVFEVQNIYMLFFSLGVILYSIVKPSKQHLFLAVCFFILYILPFSLGVKVSIYRSVALLIPMVLLFSNKQDWMLKVHLIVSLILFLPMAKLFIQSILV